MFFALKTLSEKQFYEIIVIAYFLEQKKIKIN